MNDKAPRRVITPRARALEQVAILQRRLAKVQKAKADLETQAKALDPEIDAVQKRLAYAEANPDLVHTRTQGEVARNRMEAQP